jgi:hypothetical protein
MRPDSLCARVLKGKYFPSCSFLEARRKKKSSDSWRAILFGREALIKGLIKRVGLGDSINIWEDNWLSGLKSMKPLIRQPDTQVQMVSDLFIPGTRQCNIQLINDYLCPIDAEEILKL